MTMKIATFAGRVHHSEKLSCIVDALMQRGHDSFWTTAENAINLDPNVEHLIRDGKRFVHVYDYLTSSDIDSVTSMTHDVLLKMALHNERETDIRSYITPFWVSYSVREACECIVAFGKFLDIEKPDCILALHLQNFFSRPLGYLANRRGIPVVSFQEGKLRHRDQATLNKQATAADDCARLFCWSESARQAYLEAGIPESKLVVTGIPHLEEWFGYMQNPQQFEIGKKIHKASLGFDPDQSLVSFFPPLLSRYEGNPKRALGALADWSANAFTQLAIRLHPFEHEGNVEALKFGLASHPHARVIEKDTLPLIASSNAVISQHSTVAVETLALGVPLIEIDLDNVGVLESLVTQEVAIPVGDGELDKIARVMQGELRPEPAKLAEWLDQNVGPRDTQIVNRVVAGIEALL